MRPRARAIFPAAVMIGALLFLALASSGSAADVVGTIEMESSPESRAAGGSLLLLIAAFAAMIVLGSPLFLIIGVLTTLAYVLFGSGFDEAARTFPSLIGNLTKQNVLLAIPFFVVSAAIMSAGDIANRLIAFARSLVAFLPGGLAIATVGGCIFFAAISGSSPVTVIAIGSIMYPALVKAGYRERFSLGLVTTAGSLGILIPPSIPMLVYCIVASGARPLDVGELFLAGILPGLLIAMLLSVYSMLVAGKSDNHRSSVSWRDVSVRLREGFWAIMLPVLILGGIYSGLFTPTEAAGVSVVYALIVELLIHGGLKVGDIPRILADSAVMMGTLLIIMAIAFGLNHFLVEEKIPDLAVEFIQSSDLSLLGFLLIVNVFLLLVGALMDSISAIMIIAPLIAPIAVQLGVDPIHLGIIFIVNLEIGYLTPPIGLNLFVASAVFDKKMGEVMRSVVPYIGIMLVGLAIVTYVPSVVLGPVNVFLRDKDFYEPLPSAAKTTIVHAHGGEEPNLVPSPAKSVLTVEQMMEIARDLDTEGKEDGEFAGGRVLSIEEMMRVAGAMEGGNESDGDENERKPEGNASEANVDGAGAPNAEGPQP